MMISIDLLENIELLRQRARAYHVMFNHLHELVCIIVILKIQDNVYYITYYSYSIFIFIIKHCL